MEEICDEFNGDWEIVSMHGYSEAELHAKERARITFWEDGSGELVWGEDNATIQVRYGETMEGLAAMTFKRRREKGMKLATVSGLGAIQRGGELEGSATIGGRARGFVAKRLP